MARQSNAHISFEGCLDFYRFLAGSQWEISRHLHYRKGGSIGSFQGRATFTVCNEGRSQSGRSLLYSERGCFTPSNRKEKLEMHRFYLYSFPSTSWPVRVYFVDCADPIRSGSFFHEISLARSGEGPLTATFQHSCVLDLYKGRLEVSGPTSMKLTWNIEGPSKDGTIFSSFERDMTESTTDSTE